MRLQSQRRQASLASAASSVAGALLLDGSCGRLAEPLELAGVVPARALGLENAERLELAGVVPARAPSRGAEQRAPAVTLAGEETRLVGESAAMLSGPGASKLGAVESEEAEQVAAERRAATLALSVLRATRREESAGQSGSERRGAGGGTGRFTFPRAFLSAADEAPKVTRSNSGGAQEGIGGISCHGC